LFALVADIVFQGDPEESETSHSMVSRLVLPDCEMRLCTRRHCKFRVSGSPVYHRREVLLLPARTLFRYGLVVDTAVAACFGNYVVLRV